MKTILSLSRILLVPTAVFLTSSCDLPSNEQIIDPNAEAEYRSPGVPIPNDIPPYAGAPAPQQSPAPAKNPDLIGEILDKSIEEIVVNRGPEILDSILGDSENAAMVKSVLEEAPAVIDEILHRTKGGTEIPPEVIFEAREAIAQNAPVMIDEMIYETGTDNPIARVFGEFILQKILETLDSAAANQQNRSTY